MQRILSSLLLLLCCAVVLVACDANTVYSDTESVKGAWQKNDTISFKYEPTDTINPYNVFINLRNDNAYDYSNLWLIVEMDYPDGSVVSDTLQYEMAKPDGTWLGTGFASVKESKLWYKGYQEEFVFPQLGTYTIAINHAMRNNGSINGVIDLEGVTDVGISVEKKSKE